MALFRRTASLAAFLLEPQIEAWPDRSVLSAAMFADPGAAALLRSLPLDRELAHRVPAVARARHLIAGTIADLPLRLLLGDVVDANPPYWLAGTNGQVAELDPAERQRLGLLFPQSPWWRMLWTVDDLLFYGLSCWYATAIDVDGRPTSLARIPFGSWDIDAETGAVIDLDSNPIDPARVRLIPGAHSGLLDFGRDTIVTAGRLEHTVADVAAHPFRLELHQTTDVTLDPAERAEMVREARAALNANDGVLFTNAAVETKEHSLDSGELLIGGRNAAAVDVARHASIPAAMLDATTAGASLEYATLEGRNQQWIDYGLVLYMDPIESRLGMDDCVQPGERIAFDTTELTAKTTEPTGPVTEDYGATPQ